MGDVFGGSSKNLLQSLTLILVDRTQKNSWEIIYMCPPTECSLPNITLISWFTHTFISCQWLQE